MPAGRPKTTAARYERLTARLPPDLAERLRCLADSEERPLNSALIRVVRAGLDALQEPKRARRPTSD